MAYVSTLVNTFGGTWFDMDWKATFSTLVEKCDQLLCRLDEGQRTAGSDLQWLQRKPDDLCHRKAAMWIDATSGAGPLFDPKESQVSDKVAFANAPIEKTPNGSTGSGLGFCHPEELESCRGGQEVRAAWQPPKSI